MGAIMLGHPVEQGGERARCDEGRCEPKRQPDRRDHERLSQDQSDEIPPLGTERGTQRQLLAPAA